MRTKTDSILETSRMETYDDAFDALYIDDPGKAAAMKLRGDALMNMRARVGARGGTQAEKPSTSKSLIRG